MQKMEVKEEMRSYKRREKKGRMFKSEGRGGRWRRGNYKRRRRRRREERENIRGEIEDDKRKE